MFKKGTKVTLKTNLVQKYHYGILPYFEDLEQWQGKEMTIQKGYIKDEHVVYMVDENNYIWAEEMLWKLVN